MISSVSLALAREIKGVEKSVNVIKLKSFFCCSTSNHFHFLIHNSIQQQQKCARKKLPKQCHFLCNWVQFLCNLWSAYSLKRSHSVTNKFIVLKVVQQNYQSIDMCRGTGKPLSVRSDLLLIVACYKNGIGGRQRKSRLRKKQNNKLTNEESFKHILLKSFLSTSIFIIATTSQKHMSLLKSQMQISNPD